MGSCGRGTCAVSWGHWEEVLRAAGQLQMLLYLEWGVSARSGVWAGHGRPGRAWEGPLRRGEVVRALRADASGAQHVTGATGEAEEVTGPPEGARFLGSVARLRGVLAPALWRQEGVRKLRDRTGRGRGAGGLGRVVSDAQE